MDDYQLPPEKKSAVPRVLKYMLFGVFAAIPDILRIIWETHTPATQPSTGEELGAVGFALGVLSLLLSCSFLISSAPGIAWLLVLFVSLAGIIVSLMGWKSPTQRTRASWGLALSILGVLPPPLALCAVLSTPR